MLLTSAEAKHINGYGYIAARARVENEIGRLADARRIQVLVEVDPGRAPAAVVAHQIRLTYGLRTRLVWVDHETFMDEQFFSTLVLHQLEAAIDQFASPA